MKRSKRRGGKITPTPAKSKASNKRTTVNSKPASVEAGATGELARHSSRAAWDRLLALLDHEDPKIALSVAQAILDRAWGKVGVGSPHETGSPPKGTLVIEVVTGIEPPPDSQPEGKGVDAPNLSDEEEEGAP